MQFRPSGFLFSFIRWTKLCLKLLNKMLTNQSCLMSAEYFALHCEYLHKKILTDINSGRVDCASLPSSLFSLKAQDLSIKVIKNLFLNNGLWH